MLQPNCIENVLILLVTWKLSISKVYFSDKRQLLYKPYLVNCPLFKTTPLGGFVWLILPSPCYLNKWKGTNLQPACNCLLCSSTELNWGAKIGETGQAEMKISNWSKTPIENTQLTQISVAQRRNQLQWQLDQRNCWNTRPNDMRTLGHKIVQAYNKVKMRIRYAKSVHVGRSVVWMARWTEVRGMSNALATTQ